MGTNNESFDLEKLVNLDRTFQDVKDFEQHPICSNLGWDAGILRNLIDSNMLGGGYSRKDRAYTTTELFLFLAAKERLHVMQRRIEIEKFLAGE